MGNLDKKTMLKALIDHYEGGNKTHFANRLGMTPQGISTWLSRGTLDLELIYAKCENVSPKWLLSGEGEMINSTECEVIKSISPTINQNYIGSPYYNVDFIGGFDLLMNDQTINPDFYINYPPYNKDGVVWVNLTGRSMEPELSNGDIIALKPMNTPIQYLPTKEIYAIVTEEWRTVKRIELSDRDGFIRLLPSNPEYKAQEIPISMITRVYAVLGSIRKFF